MNNKIIIGVIAIIVIAGGAYFLTHKKANTEVASNTQSANTSSTQADVETGSFKSLIDSGASKTCTFHTTANGSDSTGEIFAANGKMNGTITSVTSDRTIVTHMIYDGTTNYVWMNDQKTGFKMAIDANSEIKNANTQAVNTNTNYEFNCEHWSADNSKFEIPTDVTFSDIPTAPSGTNPGAPAGTPPTDAASIRASICANLSEPAKSQCLAGIK